MSINRPTVWILTLAVSMVLVSGAAAQRLQPFGEWDFDHDLAPFSPVITEDYGGEPVAANTGWFFNYDRIYMNVSRARAAPQPFDGDFTWGNRYDVGYMTETGHGWLFSGLKIDGPQLPGINQGSLGGAELNKTWRLDPFHHGGYVEPFVGVRFVQVNDNIGGFTENNILGGQIGARWHKQKGRWILSSEARGIGAHNYQFFITNNTTREEHVIGGEVRFQAAYLISRDIAVRFGWDTLFFGQGIARGNTPNGRNSEKMFISGLAFGVTVNR